MLGALINSNKSKLSKIENKSVDLNNVLQI